MTVPVSRGVSVLGLTCVLISASFIDHERPCTGRIVLFRARYGSLTADFKGFVSLDVTFSLIVIKDDAVRYSYSGLPVGDSQVEIEFIKRQKNFTRLLSARSPDATNVSVTYGCDLDVDFSCDTLCMFDNKYVRGSDWQPTGSNIDDEALAEFCAKGYGTAILRDAWEAIRARWIALCTYLQARRDRLTVSFRYDSQRRTALCDASPEDPISCRMTIRRPDSRETDPIFCRPRGSATSGVSFEYPIQDPDRKVSLTCVVATDFVEKRASLEVTDRVEDSDRLEITAAPVADRGDDLGLIVGLSCVAMFATATVAVLVWRRRTGPRSPDRMTYRIAVANE